MPPSRRASLALVGALFFLLGTCSAQEVEEGTVYAEGGDFNEAEADDGTSRVSSVYVMEHGVLQGDAPEWGPRGTLLLSGAPGLKGGGYEARLSDAKEFVQLRPELPSMMDKALEQNAYYAVRMYSPENPKRVLQASIPASMLANHFEDWHDILQVTVGSAGVPIALSYRVRHTLGLALFDHTQVHLTEPGHAEGPQISPRDIEGGPGGAKQQEGGQSFFRKYWWVIVIAVLLLSTMGDDGSQNKGGGGGGGGGGAAPARRS